jgi:hypothetical protein
MTGRDTLKQLAQARGISLRTAMRYHAAGVNLSDSQAVEEYKHKLRSRFGVSKLSRRTLAEPSPARQTADLEDVIFAVHMALASLRAKHPELAGEILRISSITRPVVEAMEI